MIFRPIFFQDCLYGIGGLGGDRQGQRIALRSSVMFDLVFMVQYGTVNGLIYCYNMVDYNGL